MTAQTPAEMMKCCPIDNTFKIIGKKFTVYAVAFAGIETVVGVWFGMLPSLGAGVAGLNISDQVPAITMTRHIVFGLVLGAIVTKWRSH